MLIKHTSHAEVVGAGFLIRFGILLLALLALVIFVYWPGLTGPLVLDDYANLSLLGEKGGVSNWQNFQHFVFGNASGPSGRPISALSFLIDAQDWPANIASFKYTNILIHALTGVVLCWLVITLFQFLELSRQNAALLGLLVSALWLLHPLNVATTLYVVQRMTQLMALFGLIALLCYVKGRVLILTDNRNGILLLCLALFPFALFSVLSKENGALLLLLIVAFELSIFQHAVKNSLFINWFRIGILAPLIILGVYLFFTLSSTLAGYEFRYFTLVERLLSETRVLVIYLGKIFIPTGVEAGLFHDDFKVSQSLLAPISTLFALLFLLSILSVGIIWRKKQPILFLGVAWFFAMHLLESTYIPLELYFEHRNYMSMIGPLISCVWYFYALLDKQGSAIFKRITMAIVSFVIVGMSWLTWQQSKLWGHTGELYSYWAYKQPESSRAQLTYGDFLSLNGDPEAGMERFKRAHEIYPNELTIMLHMWNKACEYGIEAPYSLKQISSYKGLEYFHNDINFHLQQLIENLSGNKCTYPELQVLVSLFEVVNGLPLSNDRRAAFHYLYSDLFVYYRQLDPALIQLKYAFDISPVPQIPMKQALISASAGNNLDALVFLERARIANNEKPLLRPSLEEEISKIEADIRGRISSPL